MAGVGHIHSVGVGVENSFIIYQISTCSASLLQYSSAGVYVSLSNSHKNSVTTLRDFIIKIENSQFAIFNVQPAILRL